MSEPQKVTGKPGCAGEEATGFRCTTPARPGTEHVCEVPVPAGRTVIVLTAAASFWTSARERASAAAALLHGASRTGAAA
jgi:hypothetical protein